MFSVWATKRLRIAALVIFCGLINRTFAATSGRVEGTVHDASGAVLKAATVTISNLGTTLQQSVQTGPDGKYAFPVLPIGRYSLEVFYSGFRAYKLTDIVVDANSALVIDAHARTRPPESDRHSDRERGTL